MKRFEDDNFKCSVCEKKAESLLKPLALKCDDCGLVTCYQCIRNKKYHNRQTILFDWYLIFINKMLKFKLILPDRSEGEIEVGNTLLVKELIDCIK